MGKTDWGVRIYYVQKLRTACTCFVYRYFLIPFIVGSAHQCFSTVQLSNYIPISGTI